MSRSTHTSTRLRQNSGRSDMSVVSENENEKRTYGEIKENRIHHNTPYHSIPYELRIDGYRIVDGINTFYHRAFLPSGFADKEILPEEIYGDIKFQLEKCLKFNIENSHHIIFSVRYVNQFTFKQLEKVLLDMFGKNDNVEIAFHTTPEFPNFRFVKLSFTNVPRDNFKVFELCEPHAEHDDFEGTPVEWANHIYYMTKDRMNVWFDETDPSVDADVDVLRFSIPYKGTNTIQGIKMYVTKHFWKKFRIMTTLDRMCRVDIFPDQDLEKPRYHNNNYYNSDW